MMKSISSTNGVSWRLVLSYALVLCYPLIAYSGEEEIVLREFWDRSDATSESHLTHDTWSDFLGTHVTDHKDGINRINYAGVSPESRQSLNAYVDSMSAVDPRTLSKSEQLAYWMNLYNALTVQVVLQHPGVDSIRKMGGSIFRPGPWREKIVNVVGQGLSLDDIEHEILRPIFRDRRIHYGVNCASLSCPNMLPVAFNANNVEAMLDLAEANYVNHTRAVAFDNQGRLTVSSIYDWYASDFAADDDALLEYLARHHETVGERLAIYSGRIRYAYDWSLNIVDAE